MRRRSKRSAEAHGVSPDLEIRISIPGGREIAEKTWNPRLGIVGGLSVLGTTGIVHPFSCAAWIHSIHRGIDVARAEGLKHVLGATGSTSEKTAQALYGLPDGALLDMGDFAGGLLKYLRDHPVDRLTIAGGFAKLAKLAQGALDLHSSRSQVDMAFLAGIVEELTSDRALAQRILDANTALEVLEMTRAARHRPRRRDCRESAPHGSPDLARCAGRGRRDRHRPQWQNPRPCPLGAS